MNGAADAAFLLRWQLLLGELQHQGLPAHFVGTEGAENITVCLCENLTTRYVSRHMKERFFFITKEKKIKIKRTNNMNI